MRDNPGTAQKPTGTLGRMETKAARQGDSSKQPGMIECEPRREGMRGKGIGKADERNPRI